MTWIFIIISVIIAAIIVIVAIHYNNKLKYKKFNECDFERFFIIILILSMFLGSFITSIVHYKSKELERINNTTFSKN